MVVVVVKLKVVVDTVVCSSKVEGEATVVTVVNKPEPPIEELSDNVVEITSLALIVLNSAVVDDLDESLIKYK